MALTAPLPVGTLFVGQVRQGFPVLQIVWEFIDKDISLTQ